jgi:hypothetical protein
MFLPLAGVLLLILAGCDPFGPTYTHLDVESQRLLAGATVEKVFYNFGKGRTLGINGGFTVGSGKDSQLLSGLPARIGDTTIAGGQVIETRFNTSIYDGSLKWRHFFAGPVGYEVGTGIAFTRLNFAAASTTAEGNETKTSPAIELMLGAVVRINKRIQFEANTTGFETNKNIYDVTLNRLQMTYKIGSHFQAAGGWTWLNASATSTGGSSYSTTDSGPSVGIRFVFDKIR